MALVGRQKVAAERVDAARKHVYDIVEERFKEYKEFREGIEKLYSTLALFAGGTIALSVTYLGYLKSVSPMLCYHWLLHAAWITLFASLICSLLFIFFNMYYAHYARGHELAEARKKQFEVEREEIPLIGFSNLQDPTELGEFTKRRDELIGKMGTTITDEKKWEKFYLVLRRICQWVAWTGYVGGIGMLLWFAVSNS